MPTFPNPSASQPEPVKVVGPVVKSPPVLLNQQTLGKNVAKFSKTGVDNGAQVVVNEIGPVHILLSAAPQLPLTHK